MVKKVQAPVIGGIRKVFNVGQQLPPGTTIAEFGSNTVTLAQLATALGNIEAPSTGLIGGGTSPPASLNVGPGLSGGGPLLGAVTVNLTAPIGYTGGEDHEPELPIPGPRGLTGATGAQGQPIVLQADDPELPLMVPGPTGAQGPQGYVGMSWAAYLDMDQGEDAPVSMRLPSANPQFNSLQISGPAQSSGWGTPTGAGVVAAFSGSAATLAQTSQAVAQIIVALKTLGLFGT